MNPPKKILVVATRRIGDVLLATPLIRSLRRAWPEARIDALVFAGTEGVLASNPDINQVITVLQQPALHRHLYFLLRLWRGYDMALSLMPSDRPTLYARIAGKHCVGLVATGGKHQWKKWLLSQSAPFDNINTHTVLMYLKLADLLDVPRCHEVVAAWNAGDVSELRKILPFDYETQAYVVLHVYPMYIYKAWRREAWVELARWLNGQGMRVVLTGGKRADEIAYVRGLLGLLPHDTVDIAGKLSLAGTACLLSKARAYVGPDTAVTHMAAALGIPTIALFGPSNPVKWGPWPKGYAEDRNPYRMKDTQRVGNVVLLQGADDCVPCVHEGCDRHTASLSDCLQNLPAARVIAALQDLSSQVEPPSNVTYEYCPHGLQKIAIVVSKYGLVGGGERFASEVTECLARNKNLDIHVFANKWVASSGRIKFHKVPTIWFPRFLRSFVFAWFTSRMVSRINFDLVHSHEWIFKGDIFSVHSVPHAGWVRDVRRKYLSFFDRIRIAVERRAIMNGKASHFFPVSSIAMEAFHREYATLPGQWQVLAPGVDVARFSTPDRVVCRADIRGRYGIGASDTLLLFVGMNFEVKGLDTIITALAKARAMRPEANIRLLVVGRGDETRYRKMAQSLGTAEAVTFAGMQIDGLEHYYRAADIFIMLSSFDTFGMVVLEAMAASLPVIVSPNVGAKDLVKEGINGFILPESQDTDAAADRIVQLLNTVQREAMGASAMQTALLHDWERLAKNIAQNYQRILSIKAV